MHRLNFIFLILIIAIINSLKAEVYSKKLINIPTAATLNRAELDFNTRIYDQGGILTEFNVGITENFYIGISFGGINMIGKDEPKWNQIPGISAKYVFLTEDFYNPSMAIGFNSQGYGAWHDEDFDNLNSNNNERYEIKSQGFFLVMSKNFLVKGGDLGSFGIHSGLNYCVTEKKDEDDSINLFVGFDKSIGSQIEFLFEYNAALNDNSKKTDAAGNDISLTERIGYMNLGLRWEFETNFYLEFDLKDILRNSRIKNGNQYKRIKQPNRELRIGYLMDF